MPLNPTIWHFHREEDARRYINFFDTGISNSLTLFAPRRKGKTALLLHDVRPLAIDRGYNVIYCTFWDNKERPAQALLTAMELANTPVSITDRMKSLLTSPVKNLSLSVSNIQIGVSFDPVNDTENDVLHKLTRAFSAIANNSKRTLLLLDEVQHLATDKKFGPLVATLRSAFDKYQHKLCALYTGSSRDGLHRLFREQKSPLFNAAQEYPLPDLGAAFINFVCEQFERASGRKINLNAALKTWNTVEKSPYHFMAIVERMLTNIETDIELSTKDYLLMMDNDPTLKKIVNNLKPIDKAVTLHIEQDGEALFSQESLKRIASHLGINEVSRSEVQNSVRRLRGQNIICKLGEGEYGIEMPEIVPLITGS
ncbi:Predicted ATPase (AAA+ superfamily) [Alteromonadaceae bacterium Bs31]|nr:Predicted ATPase (AAA+ superfamily) [Alteromonadaceae bacterium Bs31]